MNQYATEALELAETIEGRNGLEAMMGKAQTLALLSLGEEQRTANLIEWRKVYGEEARLDAEIVRRLAL